MKTIILLLALSLLTQLADDANVARESAAKAVVNQIAKGEYEAATEQFDGTMQRGLPAETLQKVWEGLVQQYGPLQNAEQVRSEPIAKYHAVFLTCEFERGSLDAKLVFDAENKIAGFFFVPSGQYKSPAYADASKFKEVEIVVGKGVWSLPGTISLPNGDGPFPSVVLVHGSGPQDRDESIGPNKPFRDLAHGLASRGIAVLRYEKRTKHHQLKMALLASRLTTKEETIDDAVAAVETLRLHEGIDKNRVFVLGHSLGGNQIPRIAAASEHAAGYIILAGSTRPLEDLIAEQTEYILNLDGKLDETEQDAIRKLKEQIARVKSPELNATTPLTELPLGVPAAYWLDLREYNPAKEAKAIEKSFLILQGERDYQVTMEDFAEWKHELGSRNDVAFIAYPKLNHLFMVGEGKSVPAEYSRPANVDEQVIADIAKWIESQRSH